MPKDKTDPYYEAAEWLLEKTNVCAGDILPAMRTVLYNVVDMLRRKSALTEYKGKD